MDSEQFSVTVEHLDDRTVVWIRGELDIATAPQLRACLAGIDARPVTLDFSGVTFMDSSGIAVLAQRHSEVGAGALVLRGVQPAQMKIFEVTRLDKVLNFDE